MAISASVIFGDVEVGVEKVLHFVTGAQKVTPAAAAAVGAVFGAVATAIQDGTEATAEKGVNIALDVETFTAVKAVWSEVEALLKTIGVKIG